MSGRTYALSPASLGAIKSKATDREQACADLAVLMQRGAAALALWWRISRERFDLMDLSAHSLRDIGLARVAAAGRCDRAFWKV